MRHRHDKSASSDQDDSKMESPLFEGRGGKRKGRRKSRRGRRKGSRY